MQVGQLEVMEPEVVWRALNDYKNSNADFPDHLLARINQSQGCDTTVTFDKRAAKQPGFQMLR
jgi:predicted nucleic-acid-binding protein